MISVEDIRYRYAAGVEALQGVSLTVEAGELVAIIGENGAGKTTLVRHFNGLLKATQGRVVIDGLDASKQTVARLASKVGYAFQNPDEQLFERTVRAEVAFGPRNLGFDAAKIDQVVKQALIDVELAEYAGSHPYDLPYFQRKLIALAATLAMQTPIVVLDEPTTGQDARGVARIAQIIAGLHDAGRTVIAITHDLDFCAEHFSRVIVMGGGKIIADGAASSILGDASLLSAALVDPPQMVRLAARLGIDGVPLTPEALIDALQRRDP